MFNPGRVASGIFTCPGFSVFAPVPASTQKGVLSMPRIRTILTALLMTVVTVSIISRIPQLKTFVFNE